MVMHDDHLLQSASSEAFDILNSLGLEQEDVMDLDSDTMMMAEGMSMADSKKLMRSPVTKLADFAANRLRRDARIATFSINGWDTHRGQKGAMRKALNSLNVAILRLKQGLGGEWQNTAVVAMTEFGRTARQNGTFGTDHGTGGLAVFAGGALKGGKVMGDWPGLAEVDLYARRDLMPTRDVRSYAGWLMRGLYGFDRALIEDVVFPGLDLGSDPGVLS